MHEHSLSIFLGVYGDHLGACIAFVAVADGDCASNACLNSYWAVDADDLLFERKLLTGYRMEFEVFEDLRF